MTTLTTYKALAAATVLALAATAGFTSCNDNSEIGGSIAGDSVRIVVDSGFRITGHSYIDDVILSRTTTQMLGTVDVPEYGSITSEVVTQFMPAIAIDTVGVTDNDIDSLRLVFIANVGEYVGDQLAPVGVDIYPLTKQITSPIYSDFDAGGYYDADRLLGSTVYNLSAIGQPDSTTADKYRIVSLLLPVELGKYLFREYKKNPASYASPTDFAKIFPGLYFKNSYGGGRISRFAQTSLQLFFHAKTKTEAGKDTVVSKYGNYFAVTPEIVSNNIIRLNRAKSIDEQVAKGDNILLAPAGYNIELTFPTREIVNAYKAANSDVKVVNGLELYLPVEKIPNKYDITPPPDVLLVLKKDLDKFFLENKMPDNITSFRATYNSTLSAYTFGDMRGYIVDMIGKETITPDDYTFCLVPISVVTETNTDYYYGTSSVVTGITPYVTEPKMAKILLDKAKITFVYSKQTIIF